MDLRVLIDQGRDGAKHQPEWLGGVYDVLRNKQSNIEVCLIVQLPYAADAMQSSAAIDIIAKSALAMKPFLEFVLKR